ncbi:MAG: hypothetical protein VXZ96_14630 [Myxococcota bacterium]|nr:hypothetical protein [Myxococcota bacterium]MEC8381563.1 hypothetical protein [Myxococcota bacterium]
MSVIIWFLACVSEPSSTQANPTDQSTNSEHEHASVTQPVEHTQSASTTAVQRMIYLTDLSSLKTGNGALLKAVPRSFGSEDGPQKALDVLYLGPTPDETDLTLTTCGSTSATIQHLNNGVAYVQLNGECHGCGTHSIFDSISATLKSWPNVSTVVGFGPDEPVRTGIAEDKYPRCLEP